MYLRPPTKSERSFLESGFAPRTLISVPPRPTFTLIAMTLLQNWVDGFKPAITEEDYELQSENEKRHESTLSYEGENSDSVNSKDMKNIPATKRPILKKSLKSRHLAFIALGGGIGTGLFVGSGSTLAHGGPGSIIIDYTLMGFMILTVLFALGELASLYPLPGAFSAYSRRFVDPALGFAIGYNYLMQWLATFPLEFTAATIVISYWNKDESMPNGAIVAIFWVFIIILNLFGARGYAEFEFCATSLKMLTLIGFIICAAVIDCGGAPNGGYRGAGTWYNPGAFNNNFKGFCSVLTTAAFAFTGTEVLGLAAAESSNPRKFMPRACKLVMYRVIVFYALSLFMVTLLVPYDHPMLTVGKSGNNPNSSPFVLAIKSGGIRVLPDIVNAVIMLSAISVSNSAVFAASRTLHALAGQGMAPQIFAYVDRAGRPLVAAILSLLFGALAFMVYVGDDHGAEVFNWLLAISGLSILFTWASICLSHIRFRAAWVRQGRPLAGIPWQSPLGVYGSYIGLIFNVLVVIAQFYNSAFPIDEGDLTSDRRAYEFFLGMISLVVFLVFFFAYKIVKRTRIVPLEEIDLDSGLREVEPMEVLEQERAQIRSLPLGKRLLHIFF